MVHVCFEFLSSALSALLNNKTLSCWWFFLLNIVLFVQYFFFLMFCISVLFFWLNLVWLVMGARTLRNGICRVWADVLCDGFIFFFYYLFLVYRVYCIVSFVRKIEQKNCLNVFACAEKRSWCRQLKRAVGIINVYHCQHSHRVLCF